MLPSGPFLAKKNAARYCGLTAAALVLVASGCRHQKPAEDLPKLDELSQQMKSKDKDERYEAIRRLPKLVATNKEAVALLIAALSDKDEDVRWVATDGLAKSGAAAGEAAPKLIELLRDPSPTVRGGAATALSTIGVAGVRGVAALENVAANDRNADVRSEANRAKIKLRQLQHYQLSKSKSSN
jgi:HEAT repeat protein